MPESKKAPYGQIAILLALIAAIAAVLFYSLGGSPGTFVKDAMTAQAEDSLRKEINSESQGNIELAGFAKTDGTATETFGVKGYNLQFSGQIVFKSAGHWLAHNPMAGPNLTFTFSATPVAFGQMNGATKVSAGASAKIAGTMEGLKSDNGWNFNMSECHVVSQ
jgi:hypothetical protein